MTEPTLDLAEQRRLLLARLAELQSAAGEGDAAAASVELDQTRVGRLSRMDALQEQAMSVEHKRRRGEERSHLQAALRRLDADDYGYCRHCDEPIAAARLRADPAATLCIQCAGAAEQARR